MPSSALPLDRIESVPEETPEFFNRHIVGTIFQLAIVQLSAMRPNSSKNEIGQQVKKTGTTPTFASMNPETAKHWLVATGKVQGRIYPKKTMPSSAEWTFALFIVTPQLRASRGRLLDARIRCIKKSLSSDFVVFFSSSPNLQYCGASFQS